MNNLKDVGKNKKGFGEHQYKRESVTKKLYHMVGAPTLQNLNLVIRQKIIENFSVKFEDIEIAQNIFGRDVSTLKGRTAIQSKKCLLVIILNDQEN